MATLPDASESRPAASSTSSRLIEYETFIEDQLRKTRSHVRGVDLAAHLLTLLAGMLGYLLLAALVDHWVVPGGLGFWGRLLFLAGGLALAGYLLARTLPLLIKRINPLYAAQTIERSRPALKNGLLNFLFFRENPASLNPVVYQAIEEQAATNLAHNHEEVAVDRTQLIRVGYVLVGILLLCAVYTLFSPKDLFRTAGRVLMPWATIEPPTRTIISEIEPGSAQAFRGDRVTVKAHVENLKAGERVTLYYSTADAQTVDRPVEMRLPPDGYKYECEVPAGDASLQQTVVYRIEAGDAVSPEHRLNVTDAPTILVRSVEYKYPAYTGLRSQRVENQGDLKAIEGTEITLHAQANETIDAAHVDFNCDDQLDRRMTSEENRAHASFFLALEPDRQTPKHGAYRLIFRNAHGQRNPLPVRHEIEVTRDLSPEIQFVSPQPADIELPLDGAVELEVVANDPDFALRSVKLRATSAGQPLVDKVLLDEVWRGQSVKKFTFAPRKLGLKAGDVVEYTAVAEDNKDPQPNRVETAVRRIRIVSPAGKSGGERLAKRDPEAGRSSDEPGASEPGSGQNEHPRDAEQPASDPKADDSGAPSDESGAAAEPAGESGASQPQAATEGEQGAEAGKEGDAASAEGGEQAGEGANAQGERGADDEGQQGAAAAPSDGSNDGEAFERILKKLERDPQQQEPGKSEAGDQEPHQQPGKSSDGEPSSQPNESDASEPGKSPREKTSKPGEDQEQGTQPEDARSGADKPSPNEKENDERGNEGSQPAADRQPGKQSQEGQSGQQKQPGAKQEDAQEGKQGQGQGEPSGGQGDAGQPGADAGQEHQGNQGAAGQPGDKSGAAGQGKQPEADAADGSDTGQPGQGQPSRKQADGKTPPAAESDAGNDAGDKGGQPTAADGAKSGKKPAGQGQPTPEKSPADGEQKGAEKSADGENPRGGDARDSLTPDEQPASDADGRGAKSQDDPLSRPDKQAPRDKQGSNSQGGDGEKNKGNSGAGQRGQESQGSPSPDQPNQPREKRPAQSQEDQEEKPNDEAQSPSNSQRESDSEGQDSGDRSGGGKQGGGQKANKSGTGGAGQNTAADEGAGQSQEAGQGEDSDRAGTDAESDKPTGQQGTKQGAGSKTRPSGDKAAGEPSDQASPEGQPGSPSDQPNTGEPGAAEGAESGEAPSSGKSNAAQAEREWQARQDQADKANLEYAQKATDLALRHLKDELANKQGDPPLLKELGWSRDDAQRFIDRWEQMRAQAGMSGQSGKTAQRELDDTLRSLGLRARATTLQGNQARGNKVQGYKESRRATPPPEFAEEYKAYTEGTARGGK